MAIKVDDFIKIWRDPQSETGLSALEGDDVAKPSDMPEHLVEAHVFRDGQYATTFLDGLRYMPLGNSIAITWQEGSSASNRIILIARFDEPRPDGATPLECLKVVRHEPNFAADTRERERAGERLKKQREDDYRTWNERARRDGDPVAHLVEALGMKGKVEAYASATIVKVTRPGSERHRFAHPDVFTVDIEHNGGMSVRVSQYDIAQGDINLSDRFTEIAAKYGFSYQHAGGEFETSVGPTDAKECAMAIVRAEEMVAECQEIRNEAYRARFRAGMKVTAARKRLFAAGRDSGIYGFVNRGSRKARAGSEEIGPTEIADLTKMGWIEPDGGGYRVTDAALAAAKLPPRDGPTAPRA